jgi:hypothetical protein
MALILSLKCERRRIGAPPLAGLFACEPPKVKQMRGFLDRYDATIPAVDVRQVRAMAIWRSGSFYSCIDLSIIGNAGGVSMRKLVKLAFAGVVAAAIAGTAVAASADRHRMDVALPGGGTAHIEYYGDVAPKVTIAPGPFAPLSVGWAPMAFPDFRSIIQRMNAEQAAMMKQVQEITRQGVGSAVAPIDMASYGTMPAGANSVSVVSVSNGGGTCTRTTQIISQGSGIAPKVVSNISGNCGTARGAKPSAAVQSPRPINRT